MTDDRLMRLAEVLIYDVHEGLGDVPLSEEVFTRLILERLEDAGHLEGTFPLYQQGRLGNAIYRIDGYAFDEESSRLELFTTIYVDDLPPERLPAVEIK